MIGIALEPKRKRLGKLKASATPNEYGWGVRSVLVADMRGSRVVEGMCIGLEGREKQQTFDREKERSDEHLWLSQINMVTQVVCKNFGFNPIGNAEGVEVEWYKVWLARLDASVATAVRCLTDEETRGVSDRICTLTQRERCETYQWHSTENVLLFVQYWAGVKWRVEQVVR